MSNLDTNVIRIERTAKGLRNALFDEMDALRDGRSNPHRATAMSKLSAQVTNLVRTEIEFQKHVVSKPLADGNQPNLILGD